jgi:hypothetical protein
VFVRCGVFVSLGETCPVPSNKVSKNVALSEIHLAYWNYGEHCTACHHVEQSEQSSDAGCQKRQCSGVCTYLHFWANGLTFQVYTAQLMIDGAAFVFLLHSCSVLQWEEWPCASKSSEKVTSADLLWFA